MRLLNLQVVKSLSSSDWKRHGTLDHMKVMYETRGIKPPLDYTPNLKDFDEDTNALLAWRNQYDTIRVHEINEYLKNHPEVTHWVAVDDMDLSKLDNFVLTAKPHNEGIKQSGLKDKIMKFLE